MFTLLFCKFFCLYSFRNKVISTYCTQKRKCHGTEILLPLFPPSSTFWGLKTKPLNFILIFFLAALCSLWELSSSTRD